MVVEAWLAFVAASIVVLLIPGPTILAIISYAVAHGRRAYLPLVLAVILGDSTALCASLIGLGALLATSAFWFTVVKVIGGVYLLYLGVNLLKSGAATVQLDGDVKMESRWRLFSNTYLVTTFNPKGIVFYLAFLPQFVSHDSAVTPQLWILATTFVGLATVNALLYSLLATRARAFLATKKAMRRFKLVGGSMLSGAGVWTLLARQP